MAERVECRVNDALRARLGRHVLLDGDGSTSGCADLLDDARCGVVTADPGPVAGGAEVGASHQGTAVRKEQRVLAPDAAAGAGDDDATVFEGQVLHAAAPRGSGSAVAGGVAGF